MQKIFIISQPRSGSSMLQHVIGAHEDVHTFPESWLLLPMFYALRESGHQADYQSTFAAKNINNFILHLPDGMHDYTALVNTYIDNMFARAAIGTKCKSVMDKTPRYYHILDEMISSLINTKIVLLIRNPLAVLASIVNVNFNGNWMQLSQIDRYHDLVTAPSNINAAKQKYGKLVFTLKYEDFVTQPEKKTAEVFGFLGLSNQLEAVTYGGKSKFKNNIGKDRKSLHLHDRPVDIYKDAWVLAYKDPQLNYIAHQYLDILGNELLSDMGYPQNELIEMLPKKTKKPLFNHLVSWANLMKTSSQRTALEKLKFAMAKKKLKV